MKNRVAIYLLISIIISTQFASNLLAAEAPKPHNRSEVEAVLAKALKPPAVKDLRELIIVIVAFMKNCGENELDYPLWQKRWAVLPGGRIRSQYAHTASNIEQLLTAL
jgi:hypothetical protein